MTERFETKMSIIDAEIERLGLPFVKFEYRRSFTRQHLLFLKGREIRAGSAVVVDQSKVVTRARPGQSAHNWGFAVDYVLVVKHAWWDGELAPRGPWDDGRGRPLVPLTWDRLGRLADQVDLEWGGRWKFLDRPHIQVRKWENLRPKDWREIAQREITAGR